MRESNDMTDVRSARPETDRGRRMSGIGRVLVAVYGVLALAAVGRSFVQIATKFDEAPLAYTLSALAAVVYVVATIALVRPGRGWYRVAWATIVFEFTGVIVVGTLSIVVPRAVPARHRVVVVRPRLPVHPVRAAGARHVVARDASAAAARPTGRMPREDVQGPRRGARGLRPVAP